MKPIQLENEYHKKLKYLSAEKEKSIKKLMEEALDLLFEKYKENK
jgi:mRNA-degrading endonuclease RelE of RelBE toxin-antitoxin system